MLEPWHWLVLGFVLLIIEMFVPTLTDEVIRQALQE